jgi:hypothetical protein
LAHLIRRGIALEDDPLPTTLNVLPIFAVRPFGVIEVEDEVVPISHVIRLKART